MRDAPGRAAGSDPGWSESYDAIMRELAFDALREDSPGAARAAKGPARPVRRRPAEPVEPADLP